MKKLNLNSVMQGIILMSLATIADTILLVMTLCHYRVESTAFVVLFFVIDCFFIYTLDKLIGEYKNENKR